MIISQSDRNKGEEEIPFFQLQRNPRQPTTTPHICLATRPARLWGFEVGFGAHECTIIVPRGFFFLLYNLMRSIHSFLPESTIHDQRSSREVSPEW